MNPSSPFDEMLTLLIENPELFREKIEFDSSLLETKWVNSETLLHFLAVEGKYSQVRLLASLGANVNAVNRCGETPLHGAILSNDCKGVSLLLELGADPYILSKAGFDSLEWAEFLEVDKSIITLLKDVKLGDKTRAKLGDGLKNSVGELRKNGNDKAADELKDKHTRRMRDLSCFIQGLKRRFSCWFNKTR